MLRLSNLLVAAPLVILVSARPRDLLAQNPSAREGLWFYVGIGTGSLGCSDCDTRLTGASGGLALGGTVNAHWLVGAFTNGWVKSEDGATLSAGTLVFGARYYPSATSGFFLTGGLGIATIELGVFGVGSATETGTGALLGLGYDIRISQGVSITPFWNGIGMSFSSGDANFGQIGVGLTIH